MRRFYFIAALCAALIVGAVFVLALPRAFEASYEALLADGASSTKAGIAVSKNNLNVDIEPQKPLENPPKIVNAIYFTSWAAGTKSFVDYAIDLAANTEINAVVIDVKDYSGLIAYDTGVEAVNRYKTKEVRIPKLNALIKKLHDANVYVIARISVFQDPALASARPDLAVQSISAASSTRDARKWAWHDKKNLAWTDPVSREAWDYNIAIAKDVAARGFDELNFDYIRFPSDGNLEDMRFPFWDETRPQSLVIRDFFAYLRSELKGIKISADLFGLTTIEKSDMGIGQVIENAYPYFDFV
ncbi:MAG: putative glycoside hydrolase, partial [Patescibacteria group bacterium]